MQRLLQLTVVGLVLGAGCKRSPPVVTFTLVEASGWSQLELSSCPPERVELSKVEATAQFRSAQGLQLSGALKLERLEPAMPSQPAADFAFVPVLVREAPVDCHALTYRVPPGFFRAAPVSVAQLEAGRFVLVGSGSEAVSTYDLKTNEHSEGTLAWQFRYVFEAPSARAVAAPKLQVWDRCLHLVDPPVGEEETAAVADAGCLMFERDGGTETTRRVFGTIFRIDPKTGSTTTAPDARIVRVEGAISGGYQEWVDPDGDGKVNTEKRTVVLADGGWAGSEQTEWLPDGARFMRYRKSPAPDEMISTVEEVWADGGWVVVDEKLSSARRPPRERGP